MSPGWWGGENVCGQPPPCMAAAVGDNGVQQSCALQANAVSMRKGLSNLGQPKADPQAGEEEEDLQCGWSSDVGRVCGTEQGRSLCGTSTGRLWPWSCMHNFSNGIGISTGTPSGSPQGTSWCCPRSMTKAGHHRWPSLLKLGLRLGIELGLEFRLGLGSSQLGPNEGYLGSLLDSEGA